MKKGKNILSVEKAFKIIECFSLTEPELSLTEIAEKTALSKSSIYRLLYTMECLGYIRQNSLNKKYHLGFKLFHIASVVLSNISLRKVALPFMEKLLNQTKGTITLNVVQDSERVCIEVLDLPENYITFGKVGLRNSLTIGASGKSLLANLPIEKRDRILSSTAYDKRLWKELEVELDKIREQGFAITFDDRIMGSFSISAPIFNHYEQLEGSITAAGDASKLKDPKQKDRMIEQVKHAARGISLEMGSRNQIGLN